MLSYYINKIKKTPDKCAQIILSGIRQNNEIIYVNKAWRVIMFILGIIPEKIFKRLNF
jgi:hypothetical protein